MLHSKGRTTCNHVRRRAAALDKRVEPEVDSDVPFGKTWKLMSKTAKDVTEDVKSDMEADIIISELYLHGRKSPCPCISFPLRLCPPPPCVRAFFSSLFLHSSFGSFLGVTCETVTS